MSGRANRIGPGERVERAFRTLPELLRELADAIEAREAAGRKAFGKGRAGESNAADVQRFNVERVRCEELSREVRARSRLF